MLHSYYPQTSSTPSSPSKSRTRTRTSDHPITPIIDRTIEFKKENKIVNNNFESVSLNNINNSDDHNNEKEVGELESFMNKSRLIKECLGRMSTLTLSIESLHRQTLLAGNIDEARRLSVTIDAQVAEFQTTSSQTRSLLKIASDISNTATDRRCQGVGVQSLNKEFLERMSLFREMQTTYQGKYKQQLERQYMIVKPQATRHELDRLADMFRVADLVNAKETLASMEARQQEIRKIEQSVNELQQIFIETSVLVDKQGNNIKRLSEYVQATEAFTEQAVAQTEQAVVKKKSLRKKKWLIFLICLIIIGIVVGIVFITLKA